VGTTSDYYSIRATGGCLEATALGVSSLFGTREHGRPPPCASPIAESSRLSPIRPSKLATEQLEAGNCGTRLQIAIMEASGVGQLTSKTPSQIIRCILCSFVELLYIMQLLVNCLRPPGRETQSTSPFQSSRASFFYSPLKANIPSFNQ
jgi:hypothetical protein